MDEVDEVKNKHCKENSQAPQNCEAETQLEIQLDWEAMAVACENQLPESHSFLDLTTGKIQTVGFFGMARPNFPEPEEDHLYVPPRPSRDAYRTMRSFIETLQDGFLKEKLAACLVGKGAFRRFKDQLLEYPEIRQQWFDYKDVQVYEYIRDWLSREGIKVSNQPPAHISRQQAAPMILPPSITRDWNLSLEEGHPALDWQEEIAIFNRRQTSLRPKHTALLVIDLQKVFADPAGSSFIPGSIKVGEYLQELIGACRSREVPVFFTRHVHRQPQKDAGIMARFWNSLIVENTFDSQLIDSLCPLPGEMVIEKCRYSAFWGTPLEMILRSLKIEDLLIGGVMTNLCCESTARDAFVRDFNVFFLGDGTTSANRELHLASLKNIAYGFGRVLSVAEAIHSVQVIP